MKVINFLIDFLKIIFKKDHEIIADNEILIEENKKEEKNMLITINQFKELFSRADNNLVEILNKELPLIEINTIERIASFLAQCGHESAMFTIFLENLNYSREALLRVFPRYFNDNNVDNYARKPIAIANRAYANRMGNGDENSGDGWKYRGRGIIQLTGKNNYTAFSKYINKSLVDTIDYIEKTLEGKIKTGIWFWDSNNLNLLCNDDQTQLTRRINGGLNGLKHRQEIYDKAKKLFSI